MDRSKQQQRSRRRTNVGSALLIAILLASPAAHAQTADAETADAPAVDSEPLPLQLEVSVNGYSLKLIAAFTQLPDGKIVSTRAELTELGVAVPEGGPPEEQIVLDTIPGLSYVYDDSAQSIEIELPDAARLAKRLKMSGEREFVEAQSGNGLVLNYLAFGESTYDFEDSESAINGASATLDARGFSRFGTLRQTGILGTTTFSDLTAVRLDTIWSYSDQEAMRTYRLGDIVSGGLRWTRPIRMGGGQVQRNFDLRPDLITMPLPSLEGSAGLPSTLDVYIGDVKSYSQQIDPGPFSIDDIPVVTRSGTARLVLTDTTGREVETESEFFTSPDLLRKNLYDFSIDAGVARLGFGTDSFGYDDQPVALASLRYGLSDILTGEAHVEGSDDLVNGGVGGLLSAGRLGMFSGAVAASHHNGEEGVFLFGGWETGFGNFGVQASAGWTIGDYVDLAAATEKPNEDGELLAGVPHAVGQVSLSYSFPKLNSGVGLSFIHSERQDGETALILTGSYSQTFNNKLSFFVSGFSDFGDSGEYGAFVGISMPIGETVSTTAGATVSRDGWTAAAEASRTFEDAPGAYGWRVSHSEGEHSFTAASAAYRSSQGVVEGRVLQQDGAALGNVSLDGSAVMAGGGLFLGNRINDSFAVVDAGAEGVDVQFENRFAGKTGKNGKLLLPNLRAYQKNKIAIDVNGLPLNAEIPESESIVVPREMSGVVLDFGIEKDNQAAIVVLTGADGAFLPEGSEVLLEESGETFFVGYDGQAYLTGVSAKNTVTAKLKGNSCKAEFGFEPDRDNQVAIGPLPCI
jgi:outer membrane usher protein